jgi:hypothetical protein
MSESVHVPIQARVTARVHNLAKSVWSVERGGGFGSSGIKGSKPSASKQKMANSVRGTMTKEFEERNFWRQSEDLSAVNSVSVILIDIRRMLRQSPRKSRRYEPGLSKMITFRATRQRAWGA